MWAAIGKFILANPQKTAGIVQVASGAILSSLGSLNLSQRTMGICLVAFGVLQAVFGFLRSADKGPPAIGVQP